MTDSHDPDALPSNAPHPDPEDLRVEAPEEPALADLAKGFEGAEGISQEPSSPPPPDASIFDDARMLPLGPAAFFREALSGWNRWQAGLMAGWAAMALLPAFFWARHMAGATGNSALPSHWGEMLSGRDVWELFENGELKHEPFGTLVTLAMLGSLMVVLWCGWRLQAERVGLRARLGAWFGGLLDTALLALPLILVQIILLVILHKVGDSGLAFFGWVRFIGNLWVPLMVASALNLQWWLLRLTRADGALGGFKGWARHLGRGFLRLWTHPLQWGLLLAFGVTLRLALHGLALFLAWRLGGGSVGRVWVALLASLGAALLGAWFQACLLRAVALWWRHDRTQVALRASLALETAHAPRA